MLATFEDVFGELGLIRVGRGVQRIVVASSERRSLDEQAMVSAAQGLAQGIDLGFDLPGLVVAGYSAMPRSVGPVLVDAGRR